MDFRYSVFLNKNKKCELVNFIFMIYICLRLSPFYFFIQTGLTLKKITI